ncbi:enoyl-CoA hydratase/isomerase family protein [Bacillus sp. 1P06AnD]|uniref:enoyl-CoA hydratase/isomerase family protein n=1 Tax=Bacillus sp. 1P06AnD TaxID=3132208 RepID=UPI0039A35B95
MDFHYIEMACEEGVGSITLNRPHCYNALNRSMVKEIADCAEFLDRSADCRCILIKANGKAFSSGADIDEMLNDHTIALELNNPFSDWDRLGAIRKPMVAAVKGFVFGGGFELALCCDLLIAATDTMFAFPEVNLGVMPGAGGTQRLTKLAGRNKALEWLWTGSRISVQEAQQYGIVNTITECELLDESAIRLCRRLAKQPPLSVRLIKESVNKAIDYPLQEGMLQERKNFYLLFSSNDQKEGMRAFLEKRIPEFKGE